MCRRPRSESSSPQRASWSTPPRIRPWVDSVSVPVAGPVEAQHVQAGLGEQHRGRRGAGHPRADDHHIPGPHGSSFLLVHQRRYQVGLAVTSMTHIGAVDQHVVDRRPAPGLLDQRASAARPRRRRRSRTTPGSAGSRCARRRTGRGCRAGRCRPATVDRTRCRVIAAGRGDVGQAGGQAGGDRVQQELDRGRAVVVAHQHGRVVGVVGERARSGSVSSWPAP